jgi:hypothetical protein
MEEICHVFRVTFTPHVYEKCTQQLAKQDTGSSLNGGPLAGRLTPTEILGRFKFLTHRLDLSDTCFRHLLKTLDKVAACAIRNSSFSS